MPHLAADRLALHIGMGNEPGTESGNAVPAGCCRGDSSARFSALSDLLPEREPHPVQQAMRPDPDQTGLPATIFPIQAIPGRSEFAVSASFASMRKKLRPSRDVETSRIRSTVNACRSCGNQECRDAQYAKQDIQVAVSLSLVTTA
jgi:hypothetical protein